MEQAKTVLETLLAKMGLEATVSAREDEERITLEVGGPETGLVIGKKGQTLDALQYLVNKIVSQKLPDEAESKPINVDSEGYRSRRAESLVELAHRLAEKARRTGRPVAADPMSPADRRVIHVALAGAEGLTTRSEGEGIYRHLVIIPTATTPSSSGDRE
jgi:spoIIIJ-associated protein